MPDIKVTPLGAGQDVGRSCLLLSMGGKNIMLDCGMHMGFNDERRFPDFSYIVPEGPITSHIDCVIISHFHLEHCGALPYMSEIVGYNGPIYMTHPTKAIVPILLEELRKVNVAEKGEPNFVSTQIIKNCMKKVTSIDLHQSVMVDNELEIKAYYAGHVLGAAMFWMKVGSQSVVYTGDFNMNPDRHLGAAWIDKCQPDLLITESIFATTKPSKQCRDRDFLKKVHDCMSNGGKVLIPVYIVGRAQELCILLNSYWKEMDLSYPIYFAADCLTDRVNSYYKMFVSWTNEKMQKNFTEGKVFELKHIKAFDKSVIDNPGPMVVLATNGMLQQGLSMQIFKKWASDKNNLLILPDHCTKGTLGHKIVGGAKQIQFRNKEIINVNMEVESMSFDAVADSKGIMQLIEYCEPKNVVLVHGKRDQMPFLCSEIKSKFQINCSALVIGETCVIETLLKIPTDAELRLLKNKCSSRGPRPTPIKRNTNYTVHVAEEKRIIMLNVFDVCKEVFMVGQSAKFCAKYKFYDPNSNSKTEDRLYNIFKEKLKDWKVTLDKNSTINLESVEIKLVPDTNDTSQKHISVSWDYLDEDIAAYIIEVLSSLS